MEIVKIFPHLARFCGGSVERKRSNLIVLQKIDFTLADHEKCVFISLHSANDHQLKRKKKLWKTIDNPSMDNQEFTIYTYLTRII